ncbi:hypothetical protein VKT23_019728 [Stygiomarasmius scandens]|uniref:KOW domain-containing protein n=1 Tax=Marasmiellus scandens TaxID=2682957 RepID=A0ABR1IKV4_9AGAR
MPSRNPFLDLEAYGSSDEDDFEEQAPGVDDEDGAGSEEEIGEEEIEEEEEEEEEAGTLKATNNALAKLRTVCPVLLPSDDNLVDKPKLHQDLLNKALLLSERKPLFWRIRCITGQEIGLVFDIMTHVHPSAHDLVSWCLEAFTRYQSGTKEDLEEALKELLHVETIPRQFWDKIDRAVARRGELAQAASPPPEQNALNPEPASDHRRERAFEYLISYAHSEASTIPEAEKEVASILGLDSIPQLWSTAIGTVTLEPSTDINDALQALDAMKSDLVPSSISNASLASTSNAPLASTSNDLRSDASRAKDTLISTALSSNENTYHVFSAFSVPGVTGSVYVEAYLGQNPQSSRIVKFLRQHPAVIKPVSPQDVADLLTMSHPSFKLYDWARVTRGLYKNDIGLVVRRETSTGLRRLGILLVPRLKRILDTPPSPPPHSNHPLVRAENSTQHSPEKQSELEHCPGKPKREKEQRTQCLFNPEHWPEGDGTYEWKRHGHETYEMAADIFSYDLLLEYLPYSSVTDIDVHMDINTRRLFKASRHPLMQKIHLPLSENWVFLPNEAIEVIHGAPSTDQDKRDLSLPRETYRKTGRIDQVERDQCFVHFNDYNDDPYDETTSRMDVEDTNVWISKINLRKKIYIGDHVEVIAGDSKGRHGFVVGYWGLEVDLVDMGSDNKEPFNVDINSCRITQARNDVTVPWINRHVTVIQGQYLNYSGIVSDAIPPPPSGHTMLDVMFFNLSHTVRIRHDDVKDTW